MLKEIYKNKLLFVGVVILIILLVLFLIYCLFSIYFYFTFDMGEILNERLRNSPGK